MSVNDCADGDGGQFAQSVQRNGPNRKSATAAFADSLLPLQAVLPLGRSSGGSFGGEAGPSRQAQAGPGSF